MAIVVVIHCLGGARVSVGRYLVFNAGMSVRILAWGVHGSIVVQHALHDSEMTEPTSHQRPILVAVGHEAQAILDDMGGGLDSGMRRKSLEREVGDGGGGGE